MSRKSTKRTRPLTERTVDDQNFAHTVLLLGACASWAETVEVGQRLAFNDLNMVQIPVEIALAFVALHIDDDGKLGEACKGALDLLATFRSAYAEPAQ